MVTGIMITRALTPPDCLLNHEALGEPNKAKGGINNLIYSYCTKLYVLGSDSSPVVSYEKLVRHRDDGKETSSSASNKFLIRDDWGSSIPLGSLRLKGATSWMAHLEKIGQFFLSSPFTIGLNLLHPQPSCLIYYHLFGVFLP